jgi:hypothetical protein
VVRDEAGLLVAAAQVAQEGGELVQVVQAAELPQDQVLNQAGTPAARCDRYPSGSGRMPILVESRCSWPALLRDPPA